MGHFEAYPHRYKVNRCPGCGNITHISRNVIKVRSDIWLSPVFISIGACIGALIAYLCKI